MEPAPKEIEILERPELCREQLALLEAHSILNGLNILHGELTIIGLQLDKNEDLLIGGMKAIREHVAALSRTDTPLTRPGFVGELRRCVMQELEAVLARFPAAGTDREVAESLENLASVFTVIGWRAAEILARHEAPNRWRAYTGAELESHFRECFAAIEKNSKGRYRILYNLAQQEQNDYYIRLDFSAHDGGTISMPPVLEDVMRDLLANARKYTEPGGRISCGLFEDARSLRLVVEDTGRGIPPEDIPAVFEFGIRGSNVAGARTMGGGFGLTKALCVTRRFGGRLWIASRVGRGTRIRIEMPRPAGV